MANNAGKPQAPRPSRPSRSRGGKASAEHYPMPLIERAKQFMPFAALKGFDEALAAAARAHAAMKPPPSPPRHPQ